MIHNVKLNSLIHYIYYPHSTDTISSQSTNIYMYVIGRFNQTIFFLFYGDLIGKQQTLLLLQFQQFNTHSQQ
jgi:hypothetical protein